jgi:ribosomal protein L11 methyltransferase
LNWLEVSLNVNGELAEAVADVLARFAPNGVVVENGVYFKDADDPGTSLDILSVRAYLPVDDKLEETRQRLEEALWYLGSIQPLPAPVFTPIADQNWMESWKEHYRPIPIGERLIIVPAWLESPDLSRIPIRIDPGMAFGTGTHPTTQLCLDLLEKQVHPAQDVIDEAAVSASAENAHANDVLAGLETGLGSLDEILANQFSIHQAPLVLANILASILVRLFDGGLGKLVTAGGVLILSGILEEQADMVIQSAAAHGFKLIEKRQIGDWVALLVG